MRFAWTLPLLLAACGPQSPEAARIDNIQDAAEVEADAIRSATDNQTAEMRARAKAMRDQAATSSAFDAERLQTRAEALSKEAQIVERHGAAQVRAVRDRARAEVSAVRAQ